MSCSIPAPWGSSGSPGLVDSPPLTVWLLAFTWEHKHMLASHQLTYGKERGISGWSMMSFTHSSKTLLTLKQEVLLMFLTGCTITQTIALSFVCPLCLSPSLCLFKGLCRPLRSWGVEFQSCLHTLWFTMETELALLSLLSRTFLYVFTITIQDPVPLLRHLKNLEGAEANKCGQDYHVLPCFVNSSWQKDPIQLPVVYVWFLHLVHT